MPPILKESLRDIVYKRLHEMVENSRFSPGTRINVEELTVEMGVSRTPLWQAISKLEKEGLVKSIPNKGVFVQTFSPEELFDLFSVREALECLAAELAVPHLGEEAVSQLEQNLEKQREAISEKAIGSFSQLNTDFHDIIIQASGNDFLVDILNDIRKKLRPAMMYMDTIMDELYKDHTGILNAIQKRDTAAVQNDFRMHNTRMKTLMQQLINSEQEK